MIEFVSNIIFALLIVIILIIPIVLIAFIISKIISNYIEHFEQKLEIQYANIFGLEKQLIEYNTKICKLKHEKTNGLKSEIQNSRENISTSLPEEKEELYKIIRKDLKLLTDLEENYLQPLVLQKEILENQIEYFISNVENKKDKKYLKEEYHNKQNAVNIQEFEK